MSKKNRTASSMEIEKFERMDLRRRRADFFTAMVFEEIRDLLPDDTMRDVRDRLLKVFYENGACIITEQARRAEGLEPRDELGWTPSEKVADRLCRLETMQMLAAGIYAHKPTDI